MKNTIEKKRLKKTLFVIVGIIIAFLLMFFCLKSSNSFSPKIDNNIPINNEQVIKEEIDKDKNNEQNEHNEQNELNNLEGDYFEIYFLDDDGSLIERRPFMYGSIPYCSKDIPDKTIGDYLYTFAGWDKTLSIVTGNTTYIATYNKSYVGGGGGGRGNPDIPPVAKYTVTFSVENGTAPASQNVARGSKVTQPGLNCGGYVIEKWYEDNSYLQEWDFSTYVVTTNITLYGKPTNKYVVTFDYQGKGINNTLTVENGTKVTKPSDPTYSGLTFMEWQYYSGASLVTYNFETLVTGPLTLYSKWGLKITFDKQGKGDNETSIISIGGTVNKPTSPISSGYAFKGWYTDSACSAGKKWDFSTTISAEKTLYAKWINQYPEKGDNIKLNDNKNYKVLKINGADALVIYLGNDLKSTYWKTNQTIEFETGKKGVKYKESNLDNYLENTWYSSLDDSAGSNVTKPMYDAIKTTNINQHIYTYHAYSPTDDNYALRGDGFSGSVNGPYYLTEDYNSVNVGNRHVFAIGIDDLIEYFGKDNFTTLNLKNLFKGDTRIVRINSAAYYPSNLQFTWFIEFRNNKGFLNFWVPSTAEGGVHPAFLIDLANEDVDFTISAVDKYELHTAVNDSNMGSVTITGGPKYNTGTEVLLTAKPKLGYKFVKWKIDGSDDESADKNNATRYITVSADKTYTAEFEFVMPSKGEIIKVDDKRYRVLDTNNNNNAFLLALFNASDSQVFNSNGSNVYANSELDTYLNTTWYGTLSNTMKTAIGDGTIGLKQHSYHWNSGTPSDDNYVIKGTYGSDDNYYITEVSSDIKDIGDRYVFALDVKDVADYLGKYNLSKENTTSMFNIGASDVVWFRSASSDNSTDAWNVNGYQGNLYDFGVTNTNAVHPSFWINLSVTGYEYDTESTKYTISVQTSDPDMGSVSGGGTIYKGGITTISATPIDGYRFVKWNDENTSNPRTVIITDNLILEAVFEPGTP